MSTDEEGRKKAVSWYKVLIAVMGLTGIGLLTLALIAATKYPKGGFGPPYYIGGFVAGPMALLHAGLCALIVIRAPAANSNDQVKKQELGCAMRGQQILGMFMFMGCFIGVVMAGIGGFNEGLFDEINPTAKKLAGCILGGCIFALIVNVASLCLLCTYASFFGIILNQRRGVLVTTNVHNPNGGFQTAYVTSTMMNDGIMMNAMGTGNNAAQVQQLEEQNRLLQQQIQLQQQLLNQQQQMGGGAVPQYGMPQGQYGMPQCQFGGMPQGQFGAPMATAPPDFRDAPPPSYDKVA